MTKEKIPKLERRWHPSCLRCGIIDDLALGPPTTRSAVNELTETVNPGRRILSCLGSREGGAQHLVPNAGYVRVELTLWRPTQTMECVRRPVSYLRQAWDLSHRLAASSNWAKCGMATSTARCIALAASALPVKLCPAIDIIRWQSLSELAGLDSPFNFSSPRSSTSADSSPRAELKMTS